MMHVALLRAVNVAGKNSVGMSALRALFEKVGFANPRTLLQSGNVVFESEGSSTAELELLLEAATEKRLGVRTRYFVRTSREWARILARNPFSAEARTDPGHLVVLLLKKAPAAGAVRALQAAIRGREIVRAVGRAAYITYPDGQGRSKLTPALLESKLGSSGTARNWNTALRLAQALDASPSLY